VHTIDGCTHVTGVVRQQLRTLKCTHAAANDTANDTAAAAAAAATTVGETKVGVVDAFRHRNERQRRNSLRRRRRRVPKRHHVVLVHCVQRTRAHRHSHGGGVTTVRGVGVDVCHFDVFAFKQHRLQRRRYGVAPAEARRHKEEVRIWWKISMRRQLLGWHRLGKAKQKACSKNT
jgi:hypothetical protein